MNGKYGWKNCFIWRRREKEERRNQTSTNLNQIWTIAFNFVLKLRGEGGEKKKSEKSDSICHAKITACESEKYYAVYWQIVIDFLSNQQERLQKRRVAPTTFTEIFVLTYSS